MVDITAFDEADVEKYADVLARTVASVSEGDLIAAAAQLHPIAGEVWTGRLTSASKTPTGGGERPARARLTNETLRAQVFIRDRFRCTCCGGRAVPRSILVAIHDLFPDTVPYDAHYARGKIHPVFWALAPEADHVYPHSLGGPNVLENLTTLHAACNTRKSDSLVTDLSPIEKTHQTSTWNGLVSSYPALIAAGAGIARPAYHRKWTRLYAALPA
ncbi:HNH endonuclease [Rathayibacter soli]|uniref:HNH endonuclease n=1 Tax=Rathayibacter soli TaxID=3144168 RepID=UPI0027E458AA|nr:HNH endonuclease signature motif containing protein [Glaciibacter superstes]